jgi:hypothetical protein
MAITRETVIDRIEVLERGHIQVRRATYLVENGQRISGPEYHRVAYAPGESVAGEDPKVRTHAAAAWTPDVIAAYSVLQRR